MRRRWVAPGVACAVLLLGAWRDIPMNVAIARQSAPPEKKIPRILWQTWFTSDLLPEAADRVAEVRRLNPSHAYRLVNDSEAAAFMRTHYAGRVAEAYFAINPLLGAARADLWRYCVLYTYGGFYFDLDVACAVPLESMYGADDDLVLKYEHMPLPTEPPEALACVEVPHLGEVVRSLFAPRRVRRSGFQGHPIGQNFVGVVPRHPLLAATIEIVVRAIETLDESRCLVDGAPELSRRDREKKHTWTWLRTIWLTVAFHNHTRHHGRAAGLEFTEGAMRDACVTDKGLNAAMDRQRPKYTSLEDSVPFLLRANERSARGSVDAYY